MNKNKTLKNQLVLTLIILIFIFVVFSGLFTNFLDEMTAVSPSELPSSQLSNFWGRIAGALISEGELVTPKTIVKSGESFTPYSEGGRSGGGGVKKGSLNVSETGLPTKSESQEGDTYGVCENLQCKIYSGAGISQCSNNGDCISKAQTKELVKCNSSDANELYPFGINPFEKGITSIGIERQLDYCTSSLTLKEISCDSLDEFKISSEDINCGVFGKFHCNDGKCVLDEKTDICFDSEKEKNYFVRGFIKTFNNTIKFDECIGETTLQEYYCSKKNIPTVEIKYCEGPTGVVSCLEGACIQFEEEQLAKSPSSENTTKKIVEIKKAIKIITGFFTRIFQQNENI